MEGAAVSFVFFVNKTKNMGFDIASFEIFSMNLILTGTLFRYFRNT